VNESSKSKHYFTPQEWQLFQGRVLDIGAGADPVTPDAVAFDQAQGDANHITAFPAQSFDCVYSSHCLEHMHDPVRTLDNWWSLVKPGGVLFVIVPDEDLYEQGCFPSRFNDDHKNTFTIAKRRSWSPRSHNVLELARALPQSALLSLRLNDIGYDRRRAGHTPVPAGTFARGLARLYRSLRKRGLPALHWIDMWVAHGVGIDQTRGEAMAQIELVVRKVAVT
jgi:SAM-dependent methyltransferase